MATNGNTINELELFFVKILKNNITIIYCIVYSIIIV